MENYSANIPAWPPKPNLSKDEEQKDDVIILLNDIKETLITTRSVINQYSDSGISEMIEKNLQSIYKILNNNATIRNIPRT